MPQEPPIYLLKDGEQNESTPRIRRLRELSMRHLVPSVITLFGICLGFASMRLAGEARFELAVFCIVAALVLDFLDGRVARFLHGSSRFGAELDSLADFLNFGCAPAWLIYQWVLQDAGLLGWTAALAHVLCCGVRLARFGAGLEDEASQSLWRRNYFTGVPAPAGASLLLTPLYLHFLGVLPETYALLTVAGACVLTSLLMISSWPTYSLKFIRPPLDREMVPSLALLFVLVTVLTAAFPWIALALVSVLYIATLPVSGLTFYLSRRRDKMLATSKEQPASTPDSRREA